MPPRYQFYHWNGHLRDDSVEGLARLLADQAMSVITPGAILVVDESIYEFNGECPVKRHIPRKPHPNGLLCYGLSGYFLVGVDLIPYVLDFEPYSPTNSVSAQDAMIKLHHRLRARFPQLRPHLVVDSAFGSWTRSWRPEVALLCP